MQTPDVEITYFLGHRTHECMPERELAHFLRLRLNARDRMNSAQNVVKLIKIYRFHQMGKETCLLRFRPIFFHS
jgi:hypothetical protein